MRFALRLLPFHPGLSFVQVVGEWVYDPVRSDMSESGSATKS